MFQWHGTGFSVLAQGTTEARGMTQHPIRRFLPEAFGSLALVATVVLAWPGIQVARADDDTALMSVDPALVQAQTATAAPRVAVREAPSCDDPGVPSTLDDAMVAHQIRQAMREYAQRVAAEGPHDPSEGIVLNGRGYNYRPVRTDQP
jgi:hypothetical protein